ncbi:MAG: DNA mismatch repair protein MutS, partial [Clostridia bacterium]|nr:DNA mismatch repair protein MutS [Clostridia bacterium]
NYKINVREIGGNIVFLRKIVRGGASRSFGVEVAALAGVPEEVTTRAKVILKKLERNDLSKHGLPEEPIEEEQAEGVDLKRELEGIDVNALTPLQALALLCEWKEKIKQ